MKDIEFSVLTLSMRRSDAYEASLLVLDAPVERIEEKFYASQMFLYTIVSNSLAYPKVFSIT